MLNTHQPLPTTTAPRNEGNARVRTIPKLTVWKHDEEKMSRLPGGGLRRSCRRTSIINLGEFLSTLDAVERPVEDRTGLNDLYDFRLDLHEVTGLGSPTPSGMPRLQSQPSFTSLVWTSLPGPAENSVDPGQRRPCHSCQEKATPNTDPSR